jgi:hypothetical protein
MLFNLKILELMKYIIELTFLIIYMNKMIYNPSLLYLVDIIQVYFSKQIKHFLFAY